MDRRLKPIRLLAALAALIATVVVATGCGTSNPDTERGRTLFVQKCGNCHTMAQAGTSAQVGPDLDAAFAAAREIGQDSDTIEGVVKVQVEHPRPASGNPAADMPADVVTGQDLDDVAAYVGQWAGVPDAAPPEVPGGPGAQVFANNGCGGCHTLAEANTGGVTGPNLDEVLPGVSHKELEEMIVDPNAQIAQGYPPNVMPENYGETLSKEELEDLIEYLTESTSGKKSGGA
jgi:mono/diheme cytochrome c family protein